MRQEQRHTHQKKKKKKKKKEMTKNTLQMKNQGEKLQDQINEEGIGNLPEKEIRVMIVKIFKNIENRRENAGNI